MKKISLMIIIVLLFASCRSSYQMPNDTFKRNSNNYEYKWYAKQKREIIKTVHHPRWANN